MNKKLCIAKPEKPQKPADAPPCGCLPGDHGMTQKVEREMIPPYYHLEWHAVAADLADASAAWKDWIDWGVDWEVLSLCRGITRLEGWQVVEDGSHVVEDGSHVGYAWRRKR